MRGDPTKPEVGSTGSAVGVIPVGMLCPWGDWGAVWCWVWQQEAACTGTACPKPISDRSLWHNPPHYGELPRVSKMLYKEMILGSSRDVCM